MKMVSWCPEVPDWSGAGIWINAPQWYYVEYPGESYRMKD